MLWVWEPYCMKTGVILKPQNPTSQGRAMLTGGVGSIQELRPIQSTGLAQPLLETAEEIALELKLFPISQAHTVTFFSDGMHHWFLATVLSPPGSLPEVLRAPSLTARCLESRAGSRLLTWLPWCLIIALEAAKTPHTQLVTVTSSPRLP